MNFFGASILAVLILVVLGAPRRWAALGMMAGVLYLTQTQQVIFFGLNLFAVRFLEVAGFIRVMARREFSFSMLNKISWALILLYGFTAIVFCLRSTDGQANRIGMMTDALLCYFTFRGLISNLGDFQRFLRLFPILLAPYTAMVLFELVTHHNAFSFIGGGVNDVIRGGRFRCVGSFRNPDLLGTLGASFLPLYIGLACVKGERKLAYPGMGLCLVIVWACNSGGPIGAMAMGLAGWGLWKMRKKMWMVRRLLAVTLITLVIVMKAPIWYLLARVSNITGGDGWHRAYLMDVAFQNLNHWWLAGMPMSETANWYWYTVNNTADITNQYLSFGLDAGLGAIFLLILVLTLAFSSIGKALAAVRANFHEAPEAESGKQKAESRKQEAEFLLWGLGASLAVHIINWFGITYFDQIYVVWFMQLAAISSISASCLALQSRASDPAELSEAVETLRPAGQFQQQLKS